MPSAFWLRVTPSNPTSNLSSAPLLNPMLLATRILSTFIVRIVLSCLHLSLLSLTRVFAPGAGAFPLPAHLAGLLALGPSQSNKELLLFLFATRRVAGAPCVSRDRMMWICWGRMLMAGGGWFRKIGRAA